MQPPKSGEGSEVRARKELCQGMIEIANRLRDHQCSSFIAILCRYGMTSSQILNEYKAVHDMPLFGHHIYLKMIEAQRFQ